MGRIRRLLLVVAALGVLSVGPAAQGTVDTHGSAKINCTQTVKLVLNKRVINLSGTWSANDGATYYLHQVGNCLWWSGLSGQPDTADMGRDFTNVFVGRIGKNATTGAPEVVGYWADVPRGGTNNFGTLTLGGLRLDSSGSYVAFVKVKSVGGFSASVWRRVS